MNQSSTGQRRLTQTKPLINASAVYEGQLNAAGQKHGNGILKWDDGDYFEGEFKEDEKVRGTFRWKSGDQFHGEFKASLMDGKGEYTFKDGRVYDGQWVGGFKHGKGTLKYPNSDFYEGYFVKDACQGKGVFTSSDGSIFKGTFHHDKKHGYGILILANKEKQEGYWENNQLHGVCIITNQDGQRYQQEWALGSPSTQRVLTVHSEEQIKRLLISNTAPTWKSDDTATQCSSCNTDFTLLQRRHHCRHCGNLFCAQCTSKKLSIPRINLIEPVRVCEDCFVVVNVHEAANHL